MNRATNNLRYYQKSPIRPVVVEESNAMNIAATAFVFAIIGFGILGLSLFATWFYSLYLLVF